MKKIGIDARLYFETGVGVYLRNLLTHLQTLDLSGYQFYIYILNKDSSRISFSSHQFHKREVFATWHSFSEQTTFLQAIFKDTLDLMHFPYFGFPIAYWRPFVATVHDVTPLYFTTGNASTKNPIFYRTKHMVFKQVLKTQVRKSRRIITPTEYVKNQLLEVYGKKLRSKISVVYEGVNSELLNLHSRPTSFKQFSKPFLLYVGNFYPHKNVNRLIQAYTNLSTSLQNELDLVLIGPDNLFAKRLKEQVSNASIYFYHNASMQDLAYCYQHARCLIHPSLSEGFGLPIVEAAQFGLPIVASDLPVFHELIGNTFYTFQPLDVEDITKTITAVLGHKTLKKPVLQKVFDFEDMAKQTLSIYKHESNK